MNDLRFKLIKISSIVIIAIIPILVLVGLISLYSNSLDNFYVKSYGSEDVMGLSLTTTEDFSELTTSLRFGGVDGIKDTTYKFIPDIVLEGLGDKSDKSGLRYLSYSFYLKNTSTVDCNYNMSLYITNETKDVSSAIRVMIVKGDTVKYYAKAKEVDPGIGEPEQTPIELDGQIINFLSPTTICKEVDSLGVDEYIKYSVVIWFEGEDNECVDVIKGGIITMEMDFEAFSLK